MTESVKVSVVIPTYQRAAYLPGTLRSLMCQTLQAPYEIIVVDDGSTDETARAVQPFLGTQVRYERIEHHGLPAPMNVGFALSRGEYLMLCNDHDFYEPELLASLSCALDQHQAATLALCDVALLTPDAQREIRRYTLPYHGPVDGRQFLIEQLLPGLGTLAACCMWRSRAAGSRNFDGWYGESADADLWMRLAEAGDVVHVPRCLVRIRDRDESSALYYSNHRIVWRALQAKRAHIPADVSPAWRRRLEADWRRRVDRSAAVSLLRAIESGRTDDKPAIRELSRREATLIGGTTIGLLSHLPDMASLAALRLAQRVFGEGT